MVPMLNRYLSEMTNVAIIVTDARGQIEWCNAGFERLSGYTLDELSGKTPGSVVQGPMTDRSTVEMIRSELSELRSFRTELLNYRKDGSTYWISFEVHPVLDESGVLTNYVAFEYDVTELKEAQLASDERAERGDQLAQFAQQAIAERDEDELTRLGAACLRAGLSASGVEISPLYKVLSESASIELGEESLSVSVSGLGPSPGVMITLRFASCTPTDRDSLDFVRSVADLLGQARARARAEHEADQLRESLERRVAQRTMALERLNQDLEQQIVERKDAERTARLAQREIRWMLNEINLSVVLMTDETEVIYSNAAARELLRGGADTDDDPLPDGTNMCEALRRLAPRLGGDSLRIVDAMEALRDTNRHMAVLQVEFMGSDDTVAYQARLNRSDDAGVPRIVLTLEDVTEAKRRERRTVEQTAALGHVARLETMGELAAAMAHELNQPLAAVSNYISGSIRLMRAKGIEDRALSDAMERAIVQSQRAAEIIRRIRSFSRADVSSRELTNINDVITESVELMRSDAKYRGILIVATLGEDLPPVSIDPIQMEQVCINLLRNAMDAVQINDRARRLVSVKSALNAERSEVVVSVSDRGPGISDERLANLFDPFLSSKRSGLGLGLSICRSLVEAHKGRISATSKIGEGSTFEFRLPAKSREIPKSLIPTTE